jgi:putative DNA primase/helicase
MQPAQELPRKFIATELICKARCYYDKGIPVLVDQQKRPLIKWQQWQECPQTLEEFDNLPWHEADCFGAVTGTKGTNGLYLCVIDVDTPDFDISLTPSTYVERTPRGGYHFLYWSQHNAHGRKCHDLGVELLGFGNYCRMYPDNQISNNEILEVGDIGEIFGDLIVQLGGKNEREIVKINELLKGVQEGFRDSAAIRIATYYRKQGKNRNAALELLTEWNKRNNPPLGSEIITQKIQSAYALPEPYAWEFAEDLGDGFFTVNRRGQLEFEPVKFAKYLMNQYIIKTMMDNYDMFVYNPDKGIYERNVPQLIHRELAKVLGEENRKRYYPDVEFHIHGTTQIERPTPVSNKIAVQNGILNLDSGKVEEPSPEQFITVLIPVTFNPTAECPEIDKFLSQVVTKDHAEVLVESVGYCLYQSMPIHKATMTIGTGANGKSTFLKLVETFLGSNNVSHVTLQSICENRFSSAELYGKLANLSADLPDKGLSKTGIFKMLSGNDTVQAEEKFKKMFFFVNKAKQFYSCNQIPETHDDTDAFMRRWNIIPFPNKFVGTACDPNILVKLTSPQELSGLLNKAIEVLPNLLQRGHFATNETTEQVRLNYIRQSNSAKAFIEESLEPSTNHEDFIECDALYREYIAFCKTNQLTSMAKRRLTENMQQYMPTAKHTTQQVNGHVVHVWRYVKLKSPSIPDGKQHPSDISDFLT